MTKKTRQRKNLKRRSRKQSSRRRVMRQRGGKPRTNSPFLYIEEDKIIKATDSKYYGVSVTDDEKGEIRREYLSKEKFTNEKQQLNGAPSANIMGSLLIYTEEKDIPYLHYILKSN